MADDRREQLLGRVVDRLTETGMSDLSLRTLGDSAGTSHRMLIYYFGSAEGLQQAIVAEVERRTRASFFAMAADDGSTLRQLALGLWSRASAPEMLPLVRLFFGLYGRLLQTPGADLAAGFVDSWLDPVVAMLTSRGMSHADARCTARLGMAVTRGLLLDLLTTGDRHGADAAMHAFAAASFPE